VKGDNNLKIDRLVSIILILLDKERISAQQLAEKFEVSPRTIYRDIESINMAGVPVRSIPGVGGGFEIMPNYKVEKGVFSTAELSTILMGLSSLSNMIRADDLVNALAKVKSFIPADKAKDIELQANHVYVDLTPWVNNKNTQPYLATIKTALLESKLLAFDYADRYGNKTARTAEPYQLVLKNSNWYLQGFCYTRNAYRLFKLSRISNLLKLEQSFTPRDYQKPPLDYTDISETLMKPIQLRVHKSIIDRVLDFCASEHITPDGDEYYDEYYKVDFPFIENDYYYSILLSFGDKCECLSPLPIRQEMQRRIQDIARLYGV
jgi:predicted DNA-binding transcriptional regulator YafY